MKEYGMIMKKALQDFLQNVKIPLETKTGSVEMTKIKMNIQQNYMTSSDGYDSVPYSRQDFEDQTVMRKELMTQRDDLNDLSEEDLQREHTDRQTYRGN